MMGVPAEDFTTDRLPDGAQPYTGRAEVYIPDSLLTTFKKKGAPAEELYTVDGAGERKPVSLTENQFVLSLIHIYSTSYSPSSRSYSFSTNCRSSRPSWVERML